MRLSKEGAYSWKKGFSSWWIGFLFVDHKVMELAEGNEAFIKLVKIIIDIVPKHLRALFVNKWNAKNPAQPWANDAASGQLLLNAIPPNVKQNKKYFHKTLEQTILTGVSETWDPTTLFFVFLYAELNLIGTSFPKVQRSPTCTKIDRLREIRNGFFAHVSEMSTSAIDFGNISTEMKAIAKDVFGNAAEDEIDKVVNSKIETKLSKQLQSDLDKQMKINQEFQDFIEWQKKIERSVQGIQIFLHLPLYCETVV